MAYTALKPCCFAGKRFKVGENVPAELIQPGAEKNLVKMGVLSAGKDGGNTQPAKVAPVAPEVVSVAVKADGNTLGLKVTPKGIQDVFSVLTSTVSETEKIIGSMSENDALILLHLADSRKAVKEAAQARGKKLAESGEA